METRTFFRMDTLLLTLLTLSFHCILGQNNSDPNSDPQTYEKGNTRSALENGADPLFEMTHEFLRLLHGDKFYDTSEPINVYTFVEVVANASYSELQGEWQDVASTFSAYAACLIIGLLFIISMPIAGLIFCCCYCCCKKCGGKMHKMDPPRAKCKKTTYCSILLIFNTLMLAGAVVALIGNEILHNKFEDQDGNGVISSIKVNVESLKGWVKETIQEVKDEAINIFVLTSRDIIQSVEMAARTTVNDVEKLINAESLLREADELGASAKLAGDELADVSSSLQELQRLQSGLSTKLNGIKTDVTTICAGNCGQTQTHINSLSTEADFSGLSDLQSQLSKIKDSLNITTYVTQAREEFNKTESELQTQINETVKDAKDQMISLEKKVVKELDEFNNTVNPFVDDLTNIEQPLNEGSQYLKDYGDYIWYAGIGLSCVIMLSVFFYYMGLLFGLCGQRPGDDAPCCNRGVGSNLLIAGVVFCFLFSWILMFVVTILFLTGGLPYSLICQVTDSGVENVEKFEPILKTFDLDLKNLFSNYSDDVNLTIHSVLLDCKDDKGIYSALQLQHLFDLDTVLNTQMVKDEIDKLTSKTINLSSVDLLTELRPELEEFANSGIDVIQFQQYNDEMANNITNVNLEQLAQDLNNIADSLPDHNTANSLREQSAKLKALQNEDVANMTAEIVVLRGALSSLKAMEGLPNKANGLIAGIQTAQDDFNSDGSQLVEQNLRYLANNISQKVDERATEVKNKVKNDIGKCRPVYDTIQSVSDSFCQMLLDPINAIWFGLGWALFFYIPTIVFAVLLSNLLKREEKFDKETYEYERSKNYAMSNGDYDHYASDSIPLTTMNEGHSAGEGRRGLSNAAYDPSSKGGYHNGYDRSYGNQNAQSLGGMQRKY